MTVTLYTTSTCAYCPMVKKYLDNKDIQYQEVNLDSNPERRQEAYDLSGALTVPVTLVSKPEGQSIVIGWNPGKLAEALR
jgi:glutaredoxin 3